MSLKDGRGSMARPMKSFIGTRPSSDGPMQIVPPVMMINTRDSG